MPYSVCCGAFSSMAPELDICPICREHTDWEDEDGEEVDIDPKIETPKNDLEKL